MITNSSLTIYHNSGLDSTTRTIKWIRYNYDKVWFFSNQSSNMNKGYDEMNNVQIRIPYDQNNNLSIDNFAIGDIIVQGKIETEITKQQDLSDNLIYNITSITNNNFGDNQHIHLGGR